MSKKIYVGNLPFTTTEDEIRDLFVEFGEVHSVNLITDRETGRSKGFCFIEMDEDNAVSAIEALNGKDLNGRSIRVSEAQDRNDRKKSFQKRSW